MIYHTNVVGLIMYEQRLKTDMYYEICPTRRNNLKNEWCETPYPAL